MRINIAVSKETMTRLLALARMQGGRSIASIAREAIEEKLSTFDGLHSELKPMSDQIRAEG